MVNTRDNSVLIAELKKRLAECRQDMLGILSDWHYMQYDLQPRLNYEYECIFGDLEYQIDDKDRVASKLERRLEMLDKRSRRGESINDLTIDFVNKAVDNEFRKIDEMKGGYNAGSFTGALNGASNGARVNFTIRSGAKFTPTFKKSLKSGETTREENPVSHVYRKIVKVLHPDVASENKEMFENHWDHVQNSYKNNDLEHLTLFQKTLCADELTGFEDIIAEENSLKQEIRDLELSINKERRKMEQLKQEEPFVFHDKLGDNLWIAKRKQSLRDKLFTIDKQIISHSQTLRQLTGSPKAAKVE